MEGELRKLIEKSQEGDTSCFRAIYEAYVKKIYNFIVRLVASREDAEDIVQETFIIAFNQIRDLKDPERFESWIYRIARNEVYQRFRRKKTDEVSIDNEDAGLKYSLAMEGREVDPLEKVLQSELGKVIDRVLSTLPYKLREVFVLSVLNQLSYEEISVVVGRSLLSVKTDIHRARVMAREHLGQYLKVKTNELR